MASEPLTHVQKIDARDWAEAQLARSTIDETTGIAAVIIRLLDEVWEMERRLAIVEGRDLDAD